MAPANRSNRPLLALLALLAVGILVAVFWPRSGADSGNDPTPSANSLHHEPGDSVADDSPSGAVVRHRDRGAATNPQGTARPHAAVAPVAPAAPSAQTVNGRVTDKLSGQPVAQVDVIFSSGGAEQTATSNAEGQFSLSMAPGTYDVSAVGNRVVGIGLPALSVSERIGGIRLTFRNGAGYSTWDAAPFPVRPGSLRQGVNCRHGYVFPGVAGLTGGPVARGSAVSSPR